MKKWTPKLAISRSRKNIAGAVERLRTVALEWGDVDEAIVQEAESFIAPLEEFADQIERDINERIASGDHVGL